MNAAIPIQDGTPDSPDGATVDRYADVLDAATRRLAADPELQLEVRQELRAHLDDAAAEYRAAGVSDAEAAAKATEALGDPHELAEQLWQANRRRILRRRIGRWALALIAFPAAAAACWSLVTWVLTPIAIIVPLRSMMSTERDQFSLPPLPASQELSDRAWNDLMARLSPEERAFFDPPLNSTSSKEYINAEALAARYPDDPVMQANLATMSLMQQSEIFSDEGELLDRAKLDRMLAHFDRASALEPDNGYYPLLRACVLLHASSRILEEPEERKPGYDDVDPDGKPTRRTIDRAEVKDPDMLRQGIAALHIAATKPYIDSHINALAARRLALFPPPRGLSDQLLATEFLISTLLPQVNEYRHAVDLAGAHAISLAQSGDWNGAEALFRDQERVAGKIAAKSSWIVELLVAVGMRDVTLAQESTAAKITGHEAEFRAARARFEADQRALDNVRHSPEKAVLRSRVENEAGVVQHGLAGSSLDPAHIDFGPGRRAEYAVADQLAVAIAAAVLLIVAVTQWGLPLIIAAWRRRRLLWRHRPAGEPASIGTSPRAAVVAPSLFIGWRRVAKLVFAAAVLPLAAYLLLANLTPLGGRSRGLGYTWPRLTVEYCALAAIVTVALRIGVGRMVAARATQLGVRVARSSANRHDFIASLLLATAMVVGLAIFFGQTSILVTLIVASVVALLAVVIATRGVPSAAWADDTAAASRTPIWRRRWPGSIAVFVAGLGTYSLWQIRRPVDVGRPGPNDLWLVTAVTCALVLAFMAAAWLLGGVRRALRARSMPPLSRNVLPAFPTMLRSAATTFVTAALTVAILGTAALRLWERREVAQFNSAGYSLLDEIGHSRYSGLRSRLAAEAEQNRPPDASPQPATRPAAEVSR